MTRAAALVGALAHRIDRVLGVVLRLVGLRWLRGSLVLGVLLAALCGLFVSAALRTLEARPIPLTTTMARVTGLGISSGLWVSFPASVNLAARTVAVPFFASGALVGEVERLHYLARDPDGSRATIILRAVEPVEWTLRARVAVDADSSAALAEALDAVPGGVRPLADRHLVDLSGADSGSLAPSAAVARATGAPAPLGPAEVGAQPDGTEVLVAGRVLAWGADPGGEGQQVYLVGEPGGTAVLVRSPQPPEALRMMVTGTLVFDPMNIQRVVDGWELAAEAPVLDANRLVATDFAPPYQEPSWIPAILAGVLAAVVLVGALVPYPVFRSLGARAAPIAMRGALPIGEALRVRLFGRLPSPRGGVRLDGEEGQVERLPVGEAARAKWRFWGGHVGDLRRDMEAAIARGGDLDELVLQSASGGVFWEPSAASGVEIAPGSVYLGRRTLPGLRLRGEGVRAVLTFDAEAARDRALAELRSAIEARAGVG